MKHYCAFPALTLLAALGITNTSVQAQDVARFYKDHPVTMVIGANPGGGYDTYARLIARHIGKHIPGKPREPLNKSLFEVSNSILCSFCLCLG